MKQLWNMGVITATFRRIKTLGIVAGVILLVQVTTGIIGTALMRAVMSKTNASLTDIGLSDISWLVYTVPIVCMITAFLMTLIVFNYLNKKDKSDFFHALPHKRETMFVSMLTAVVLMVALIAVSAITVAIVLSLSLSIYPESIGVLLMIALNSVAGAFLVAATVGFVMSITGTVFSNVVVSLAVMFLPRALVLMFSGAVAVSLPEGLVPYSVFSGMLSDYNVVSSTFIGFGISTSFSSFVYTAFLGVVFTVLGALLYRRRKSESAGNSAPSRKLQAVYRLVIGFAMFSVITAVLAIAYFGGGFKEEPVFVTYMFVVAYIFASILYFLFELISTKRWANVGRAAPGLGIVALASAVVFGGMVLAYNVELNYCPEVEEIESISFVYELDEYNPTLSEYLGRDIGEYPVYDKELITVARDALADRIEEVKADITIDAMTGVRSDSLDGEADDGFGKEFTICFNTGLKQVERKVEIPYDQVVAFKEQHQKCLNKALKNSSLDLDPDKCSAFAPHISPEDDNRAIMQSALAELKEMGAEEWIEREVELSNYFYGPSITYNVNGGKKAIKGPINIFTLIASYETNIIDIPIAPETLPKTYEMYIESLVEQASKKEPDYTELWESLDEYDYYVLYIFDENNNLIYSDDYDDGVSYDEVNEIVQYRGVNRKVQNGDMFVIVSDYYNKLYAVPLENVTKDELYKLSNIPDYKYNIE